MKSPFLGFESEQALRHIADALADGLFTTDAEGRITYWNEAAERITGWSAHEALGKDCSLLAGDVVNGCACGDGPIRCGLALDGRRSKQCTTRTKDGRFIDIVKSAVPIRDASGEAIGALESFTPVRHALADQVPIGGGLAGLVGRHPAMQELFRLIKLVASSTSTVMIVGESGVGKDLVAEAIHRLGPRGSRELVRVPCAALDALLAIDGSVASAVEGGVDVPAASPLDQASGGTLLLDEVSDLSATAQQKLLHFLEQREAKRIAGPAGAASDLRILCTTNADLKRAVDEKRFRADLYFRLNVFPLRVPPLREHVEDVPLIAEHLLRRHTPPIEISDDAGYALIAYGWPGNVRELQNVLEYAALQSGGQAIRPEHLPPTFSAGRAAPAPRDERAELAEALARSGGSRTLAARALGISRVTLWKRMKKHGVLGEPGE